MGKWLVGVAAVVAMLVGGTGVALAQNAQVVGTLVDSSGGVLPGVTVTARNEETGLTRTTVSESNGDFRLSALPPGRTP